MGMRFAVRATNFPMRHTHQRTPARRAAAPLLWAAAGAVLLLTAGCAAWRLGQSIETAKHSEPFEQTPRVVAQRLAPAAAQDNNRLRALGATPP